jgi:hypothetical protein
VPEDPKYPPITHPSAANHQPPAPSRKHWLSDMWDSLRIPSAPGYVQNRSDTYDPPITGSVSIGPYQSTRPQGKESLRTDIANAIEQSGRSSEKTTVAEHPPAETPTQAARALIAWFAGGLAFESVHAFADASYLAATGYGLGAIAVAIVDYNLKALLACAV